MSLVEGIVVGELLRLVLLPVIARVCLVVSQCGPACQDFRETKLGNKNLDSFWAAFI